MFNALFNFFIPSLVSKKMKQNKSYFWQIFAIEVVCEENINMVSSNHFGSVWRAVWPDTGIKSSPKVVFTLKSDIFKISQKSPNIWATFEK